MHTPVCTRSPLHFQYSTTLHSTCTAAGRVGNKALGQRQGLSDGATTKRAEALRCSHSVYTLSHCVVRIHRNNKLPPPAMWRPAVQCARMSRFNEGPHRGQGREEGPTGWGKGKGEKGAKARHHQVCRAGGGGCARQGQARSRSSIGGRAWKRKGQDGGVFSTEAPRRAGASQGRGSTRKKDRQTFACSVREGEGAGGGHEHQSSS